GLVLHASRVEQDAGGRGAPPFGSLLDARRGNTGDTLGPRRRVVANGFGGLVEAFGVVLDELVVEPTTLDDHMEDRAEQRRVGAWTKSEEQVCGSGHRRDARVGDDELGAVVARSPDVARGDR